MAKGKEVTQAEIYEALEKIRDGTDALNGMENRINNGHLGKLEDPIEVSRSLMCASRDCSQFALRMLTQYTMQKMREETEKMIREKQTL